MTTELTDIELDEVSLVDKGANQEAHVMIVKRSPLRRFADWMMGKGYGYGYGDKDGMKDKMHSADYAMPMSQIMAEDEAQAQLARLMMALHESLESIQGAELDASEKLAMMQQSAAEFAEAVEGIEIMKSLRDEIESLSSLDEIPAAIAAINKALGNEGEAEEVADMTEPVKTEEPSVEVEKADEMAKALESEVAKREALEKKLAEMEALTKRAEIAARVEKNMGSVPGGNAGELVDLLVAIHDGAGAEVAGKVEALLVSSSEAVAESAVLEEVGKDAGAEADVFSRAQAIADELRKNDPSLTKEIALAKAFETNPELAAAAYAR
jgi:hypothetical protein